MSGSTKSSSSWPMPRSPAATRALINICSSQARAFCVIFFGGCQRDADITQAALRPEAQIHPITQPRRRVGGKQTRILIGDFFEKFLVGDFLRTGCLSVSAIKEH